jgi:hypothetical protein
MLSGIVDSGKQVVTQQDDVQLSLRLQLSPTPLSDHIISVHLPAVLSPPP